MTFQPIRRYGFDASILFSDILMLPYALGQPLRYAEGEGPVLAPIRDTAGFATLHPTRVAGAMAPIIETVSRIRAGLPPDVALIGFAGSPWTVLCYMIEGHGSKEFATVRGLAYRDPALFAAMLDLLVEQTALYLSRQVEAGADVVMLFDSWAGVLTAAQFRRYVIAPTRRIVDLLRTRHPALPVIGFPRLAGSLLAEYARDNRRAMRGRRYRGGPGARRPVRAHVRSRAGQPGPACPRGRRRAPASRHPDRAGCLARPAGRVQPRPRHRPGNPARARCRPGGSRPPCLTPPRL